MTHASYPDGSSGSPPLERTLEALWGAPGQHGIAPANGRGVKQTFSLLETGKLPAKKIGKRGTSRLKPFFFNMSATADRR
jgi:hypothetical protein